MASFGHQSGTSGEMHFRFEFGRIAGELTRNRVTIVKPGCSENLAHP